MVSSINPTDLIKCFAKVALNYAIGLAFSFSIQDRTSVVGGWAISAAMLVFFMPQIVFAIAEVNLQRISASKISIYLTRTILCSAFF